MSRYQSIGLSLRPDRLKVIDERSKELGLTRSKYFQTLIDADLNVGLLDCIIGAEGEKPIMQVKEGLSIAVLDKKTIESLSVELIVSTVTTLGKIAPDLKMGALAGNVRKTAERVVRENNRQ